MFYVYVIYVADFNDHVGPAAPRANVFANPVTRAPV